MSIPVYRRWDQPGAKQLSGTPGSGYELVRELFVEAGWTIEYDDPGSYEAVFRNNPVTGSGCYVRVKDDGSEGNFGYAAMSVQVYENMIDAENFEGGLVSWCTIRKSTLENSENRRWIFVADDRTCWFGVCKFAESVTTLTNIFQLVGVGDYDSFIPGNPGVFGVHSTYFQNNQNIPDPNGIFSRNSAVDRHPMSITRDPVTLDQTPTVVYGPTNMMAPLTNNPTNSDYGGNWNYATGDSTKHSLCQDYIISTDEGHMVGKLRGIKIPIYDLRGIYATGERILYTDGYTSRECIVVNGNSLRTNSSSEARGVLFLSIDEW